jgi:hypothetical protein
MRVFLLQSFQRQFWQALRQQETDDAIEKCGTGDVSQLMADENNIPGLSASTECGAHARNAASIAKIA